MNPSILRRARAVVAVAVLLVGAILLGLCWYTVDETRYVIVTDFGRVVAVQGPDEAGLHFKWPWWSTTAIDRRLRVLDPPSREVLTGDKRNLEVAPYVAWRVAGPERFVRAVGTIDAAEVRLAERVSAALSAAIGRRDLAAFASTDEARWGLDALMSEVLEEVAGPARSELGLEVVDVRLRRFNHPLEVRPAVFDLIRSERRQVAATLRAEGEAKYQEIISQAERERDAVLAGADAEAERIRGRGDAEATRVLNQAHAQDPRFYEFTRLLETYRALLDDKTTVVLSSASPLLQLLNQGPSEELKRPQPEPSVAEGAGP
jgi:membrane protease subunit HflC